MNTDQTLNGLPKHFLEEQKELLDAGIDTWFKLKCLTDKEISSLVESGRSTRRNLKKIRGMATLICDLNISQKVAALLLHAGFSSTKSLANSSPQEIALKTNRLERQMNIRGEPVVNLAKANYIMKEAQNRQIMN